MKQTEKFLNKYLEPIREKNIKRIKEFIYKQQQYKPLLNYKKDDLKKIPSGLSDEKLDIELHKIKKELELEIKKKGNEIFRTDIRNITNEEKYKEYRQKYEQFVEQENALGKSNLAQYIIHRKIILDLLENTLNIKDDGRYPIEERIHTLFFPIKSTSNEIFYEEQNLWIIDERLSYHKFLASDIPLNQMDVINSDSKGRPDILIFNAPSVFVNEEKPYSSIVIIEFKRPGRDDFDVGKNPINQVYGYIKSIRDGNKKDYKGRPINVTPNSPCYAYIICDITSKMEDIAEIYHNFTKTADNMGYFTYREPLLAYIEIISFDKLLIDAKKCNKILFEKLNILNYH